jgi:hypothetical protein
MRKLAIIALVIFIVIAGCAGQSVPSEETPTKEGETDRESVPLEEVTYPPGVTESGVEDVDTLLRTHRKVLSQTDYEVSAYRSYMVEYSDGDQKRFQEWIRAKSDYKDRRAKTTLNQIGWIGNGKNATYTTYSANGTHYQRANEYYDRTYNTSEYRGTFGQIHNSTVYLNSSLNETLREGSLSAVGALSDGEETFVRFRISFPRRDVPSGSVLIRTDGLITQVEAPDAEGEHHGLDSRDEINDGVDRYSLEVSDDVQIDPISWKEKARQQEFEHLRDAPEVSISDGSACNNDGDQSYNEDNDRDNDGLCDEG